YTQKFHGAFDHTHRGIAITAHDPVAQRAMIGTDAHRGTVLFTDADQRREPLSDPVYLLVILRVGIFDVFEFLFVDIIAGVDAHFLHDARSDLRGVGREMNVRHQWRIVPAAAKLVADVQQVLRFFFAGG